MARIDFLKNQLAGIEAIKTIYQVSKGNVPIMVFAGDRKKIHLQMKPGNIWQIISY